MTEKVSLRQSYVDALLEEGERRSDFVVLEADATGSTFVGQFTERFPDRHIRCGIAEQNMIGVSAGLSRTGTIPLRLGSTWMSRPKLPAGSRVWNGSTLMRGCLSKSMARTVRRSLGPPGLLVQTICSVAAGGRMTCR